MSLQAVFLDRDGTIKHDSGYVSRVEDFHLLPKVVEGLKLLHAAGARLFIITNQSGIARGFFTEEDYRRITDHMLKTLSEAGVEIEAVEHCPHHPDITGPCRCRKPQPGMIKRILERTGVEPGNCWMIGDKESDVEAGHMVGLRSLLIDHGKPATTKAELTAPSLFEAAKKIAVRQD